MIFVGPLLVFLILIGPGIRLLRLAADTREQPEFWGGLYFVGAAFGLSLRVMGSSIFVDDPERAEILNTIGHFTFALSLQVFSILSFGNNEFASPRNLELLTAATRVIRVVFVVVAPIATIALSLSFFPPRPISIGFAHAAVPAATRHPPKNNTASANLFDHDFATDLS
jgi:hypothetical protein